MDGLVDATNMDLCVEGTETSPYYTDFEEAVYRYIELRKIVPSDGAVFKLVNLKRYKDRADIELLCHFDEVVAYVKKHLVGEVQHTEGRVLYVLCR